MKSILEVLNLGTEYLSKRNIPDARINMQELMCDILGVQKIDLYLNFDKPLDESEIDTIRTKMTELAAHKPIQYVINSAQFLSLCLDLNNNVLIPRPETEELTKKILNLKQNRDNEFNVLDIGTGSGCIAISIAENFRQWKVYAIDNSAEAIETASSNAHKYNLDNIYFYRMDILKQIPKTQFDIIISNPPYIPLNEYKDLDKNVLNYEPKAALTDNSDGLTFYRRFAEIFPKMLKPQGKFYLEIGYGQSEAIEEIFSVTNFDVKVSKDLNGINRFIEGAAK